MSFVQLVLTDDHTLNFATIDDYVTTLIDLGQWGLLTQNAAEFAGWLQHVFDMSIYSWEFLARPNPALIDALLTVSFPTDLQLRVYTARVNPDYLDALTLSGVSWEHNAEWEEENPSSLDVLNLDAWAKYGTRDLAALLAQTHHSFAALKSIPLRWAEWSQDEPGAVVEKLLRFAHTRAFLSRALDECAALRVDYAGSRPAWQVYRRIRAPLDRSELYALNEGAMATMFSFDTAEEFAQRLRCGTVVEYTWPDYESYAETQHDFASCPLFPAHDPWLWEEVTRRGGHDERTVLREILNERGIDSFDLSTVPEKFRLSRMSFLHPVTDDTAASPLGSVGGHHVGLVFYWEGPYFEEFVFLGPLGTITWEEQPPVVLRRPSDDGLWVQDGQLYDAATATEIETALTHTGTPHPLYWMTRESLHFLQIRNKQASLRMRGCTNEQAQQLIDDPTRILAFAGHDEVLASAIAGILANLLHDADGAIHLPDLLQPPKFLTHLYATYQELQQP
ncbi:hypothetical protein CMUST_10655 [Corynebacterium mustelae]|uniref:Uncharacterized protein n=1 Tax=Corynebacterium mustelae TaxID=571915 RepID=A0A0G3H5L1_9CORY|nr:hypothetical protein [Corynebacterium mustelae]AKK06447.1 hypothetical protein CMUST_10655 [Corynebacterium mustelae]